MRNGQTKPGYNLQISTENQFITDFALFPNPTDTLAMIPFLQSFSNRYGRPAHTVVADSGYGSEENYRFMEENSTEAYVKYSRFHMEQRPRFNPDPFKAENFHCNEEHDFCICPMGQKMRRTGTKRVKTASGYVSGNARYKAVRCEGCPLRCRCLKAKGNRMIELNHRLRRYRQKAKGLLCSGEGLKHRGQRCIEPEVVFGQMKNNMNYKRFRHFGKDKVFMDFSFFAIAFNIKKMCAKMEKGRIGRLTELLYELAAAIFRCWGHIKISQLIVHEPILWLTKKRRCIVHYDTPSLSWRYSLFCGKLHSFCRPAEKRCRHTDENDEVSSWITPDWEDRRHDVCSSRGREGRGGKA